MLQRLFHYCSNNRAENRMVFVSNNNVVNKMRIVERSPEKAGVGGSIPSLATTSSQTVTADSRCEYCARGVQMESKLRFHSNRCFSSTGTNQVVAVVTIW